MEDNSTLDTSRSLGPRTLGDFIGDTFIVYAKYFFIMILLFTLAEIPNTAYILFGDNLTDANLPFPFNILHITCIITTAFLYFTVFLPIFYGCILCIISYHFLGKSLKLSDCFKLVFKRIYHLIVGPTVGFLILCIMVITIIGFPVAIYFSVCWIFVYFTAMLTSNSIRQTLDRSYHLVKGNWWRILGILILFTIPQSLISVISDYIHSYIPIFVNIFGGPIITIVIVLLYFDLRVRKEQYTKERLESEIAALENYSE